MSSNGEKLTRHGAPPGASMSSPPPPPNLRSSLGFCRSPLLLLAAALVALAAFFAPGGQPAQAQTAPVWSATLTVADGGTWNGYFRDAALGTLSDRDFTYGGADYQIRRISLADDNAQLRLLLNKTIPDSLKSALTLNVGSSQFSLADGTPATSTASNDVVFWDNSGLSWSVGDTVSLSLTEPSTTSPTQPDHTQTFPYLDRLPIIEDVEAVLPSQWTPEGGSASDGYCYLGEGNGQTEYVRYPDGRIAETTRTSDHIRSAFACE